MPSKKLFSVSLPEETWVGVLFHLRDTVENIPVSTVEPDPWQCVTKAIETIEYAINSQK